MSKKDKTFRFTSFTEQIAKIHIDVIHKIIYQDDTVREQSTFLYEAVSRLVDLDCTDDFYNFRCDIANQFQSFEQLIHHKEEIIAALKTHLQIPNSMAIDSLLHLVVQLARDLQADFYVYFKDFFCILTELLKCYRQDPKVLENIFSTLAYLFKFQWRFLVRDIEDVWSYFTVLLQGNQRDFIKDFASESASFLLRKVKDQNNMIDLLFTNLQQYPKTAEGIGKVLFEVVKGVNGQFHTISQKIFPILFYKLGAWNPFGKKCSFPWMLVEKAVTFFIMECVSYSENKYLESLWRDLIESIRKIHQACTECPETKQRALCSQLSHNLRLLKLMVECKSSVLIIDVLQHICKDPINAILMGESVLPVVSSFLVVNQKLPVGVATDLISSIFEQKISIEHVTVFIKSILKLCIFEKVVLPNLLLNINIHFPNEDFVKRDLMVQTLVDIILQKSIFHVEDGSNVHQIRLYLLDGSKYGCGYELKCVNQYILSRIKDICENITEQSICRLWSYLVCLTSICAEEKVIKSTCKSLWYSLSHFSKGLHVSDEKDSVLFLQYQILVTFITSKDRQRSLYIHVPWKQVFLLLENDPHNVLALRIADLYLSQAVQDNHSIINTSNHLHLFQLLQPNLAYWSHKVRLLSLHILSLFPVTFQSDIEEDQNTSVFDICLKAERIPPTVHKYRERIVHLQNLDYNLVKKNMPVGPFETVPFIYLIGNLFCNMTLIWEKCRSVLSTHAENLNTSIFWSEYKKQLELAADRCAQSSHRGKPDEVHTIEVGNFINAEDMHLYAKTVFNRQISFSTNEDHQPDYAKFRIELWKTMQLFPTVCESVCDDVGELVLTFLRNDYLPADDDYLMKQNIKYAKQDKLEDTHKSNDVEAIEESDVDKKNKQQNHYRRSTKSSSRLLVSHLQLIALFKMPKKMKKYTDLLTFYTQFLLHEDPEIQTTAFKCILSFNFKYLSPYKDNLLNILNNASFKEELVIFGLDEEISIIKPEHRADMIPILLRILFGKMLSKARKDGSGKIKDVLKKELILRFISSCNEDELEFYLKLVFSPIICFITDNPLEMVRTVKNNLDLTKVVPIKKLKGMLNMMEVVMKTLFHRLEFYVSALYTMLLNVYAMLDAILEQSMNVKHSVLNDIRTCRHVTLVRLTQLFDMFDCYQYTDNDVDALFETVVWPKVKNLNNDTHTYVKPIFSLFYTWSKHPRYFSLLAKAPTKHPEFNPLSQMFLLLNKDGVDKCIKQLLMKIVYNCLFLGNNENTELELDEEMELSSDTNSEYPVLKKADIDQMEKMKKEGIDLLLPYITEIFEYLQNIIKHNSKIIAKKGECLELEVLQRICGYIKDKEQCFSLCSLLISFFNKKRSASQEYEERVLANVENLLNLVDNPSVLNRNLSGLFFVIANRTSRQKLCEIYKIVADFPITDIIIKMNSWNPKRTDEPDYEKRLAAFGMCGTIVKASSSLDVDFLLPIVHNCCYFINFEEDMSLRENSVNCLTLIINQISELYAETNSSVYRSIIYELLIPRIKQGLISKSDVVQHYYISLWSVLVDRFPHSPSFQGLQKLKDFSKDVDFFENISHIQLNKRAVAVRTLKKYLETNTPNSGIMNAYILPIVTRFLVDESYSKHNDLVNSAVDTLGVLCKQLPWSVYYQQLTRYLQLLASNLSQQKLMVRVISVILNAFHYDLSNSQCVAISKPIIENRKFKGKKNKKEKESHSLTEFIDNDDDIQESNISEKLPQVARRKDDKTANNVKCSEELATRIHRLLINQTIPWLHRVITQRAKAERQHKSLRSSFARDDEILRVPLALAMVRLLQMLPHRILEVKLPGVISRVCYFLKSRAKEVRENARSTLSKICVVLGPTYLSFILKQMKSVLTKGYQCHVLCYTVYNILVHMVPKLKPGDLEPPLDMLTEIFIEEMFGKVSQEKEIEAITNQVFEAKHRKGADAFFIISQFIRPSCLNQLIAPLKEIVGTTTSQKKAQKISDVLQRVSMGLLMNTSLNIQKLMIFIHSLTADNLTNLGDIQLETEEQMEEGKVPHCLLLPADVPRGITKPKIQKRTNIHILVEFGLYLLANCLKKLDHSREDHLELLDPLVTMLSDCLFAKQIMVNTYSLRCISYLLRYRLPSLENNIRKIANGLFILLKNYASAGAARGRNSELVNICFKAVTVLVRDVSFCQIDKDELQVLLSFCEEDLLDYNRHSTAFSLLKAILSRKVDFIELHDLMKKLKTMCITSEISSARLQSRQLFLQYMLDYPLGKDIQQHIQYFVAHLHFEQETGRVSALEMLASMIMKFPQTLLSQNAELLYVSMSAAMVNDESEKCRKLASLCIKTLLEKVALNDKNKLFMLALTWLTDNKIKHRSLAAQLIGLFVDVEGEYFHKRLSVILPIFQEQLVPSKYTVEDNKISSDSVKDMDSCLYRLLNTLAKMFRSCGILKEDCWQDLLNTIWEHVESFLEYPHHWISLIAAQLYGLLFGVWTPHEISELIVNSNSEENYLSLDTENKLINLVCLFCNLMRSDYLDEELVNQIIKNILYIGKVLTLLNAKGQVVTEDINEDSGDDYDKPVLSLKWLVSKIICEANEEVVAKFNKETIKRTAVIKWIAAFVLEMSSDQLISILPLLMPLLQRESVSDLDINLKQLSDEVLDLIKKRVTIEDFSHIYTLVQKQRTVNRLDRKRKRAVQMMTNPVLATTKKIRKNISKKNSKQKKTVHSTQKQLSHVKKFRRN